MQVITDAAVVRSLQLKDSFHAPVKSKSFASRSLSLMLVPVPSALSRKEVEKAQRKQKHDHNAMEVPFRKGDRVFVHKPGLRRGEAHKFTRPFQGPFCITDIWETGADVVLIDKPKAGTTRVSLNSLRRCPKEICTLDLEQETDEVAAWEGEEHGEEVASCPEPTGRPPSPEAPPPLPREPPSVESGSQSGRGVSGVWLHSHKKKNGMN